MTETEKCYIAFGVSGLNAFSVEDKEGDIGIFKSGFEATIEIGGWSAR